MTIDEFAVPGKKELLDLGEAFAKGVESIRVEEEGSTKLHDSITYLLQQKDTKYYLLEKKYQELEQKLKGDSMTKDQVTALLKQVQDDYNKLLTDERELVAKKLRLEGAAEALVVVLKELEKEEEPTEEA